MSRVKAGGRGAPPKQAPAPAPSARGNSGGGGKRSAADSDEAATKKQKKGAGNDARAEALEEARGMQEAVANNGDDTSVTPPASPGRPRSSASERAKTLELNQAKDAAAKATAELERLKAL